MTYLFELDSERKTDEEIRAAQKTLLDDEKLINVDVAAFREALSLLQGLGCWNKTDKEEKDVTELASAYAQSAIVEMQENNRKVV